MIKEARKKYIVFSLAQVLRGPWYGVFNSYFVTEWGGQVLNLLITHWYYVMQVGSFVNGPLLFHACQLICEQPLRFHACQLICEQPLRFHACQLICEYPLLFHVCQLIVNTPYYFMHVS